MARRKRAKQVSRASEELNEEQLEAVSGGVGGGGANEVLLEDTAGSEKKGKTSSVLAAACTTGQHIKKLVVTV